MLFVVGSCSGCVNTESKPHVQNLDSTPEIQRPSMPQASEQQDINLPAPIKEQPKLQRPVVTAIMPHKIIIPSLRIKATVEPVGVLTNGQMGVPRDTNRTGILYPGILPGEKGNAVIDGHVDSYTGPAIFFNLKKLKPSDVVIVKNKKGRELTFVVESVERFTPKTAPLERIYGTSEEIRLNLITCTGKFNRKKKEHEERLVVFTRLYEGSA